MPLHNYGLLTGTLVDHGIQQGGNPHYLLLVKAGVIQYQVALNSESALPQGDKPAELQYQILGNLSGSKLAKHITNQNAFVLRDVDRTCPTLDFVRDGFLDFKKFKSLKRGFPLQSNPFHQALIETADQAKRPGCFVAVFGTGYPTQDNGFGGARHDLLRAPVGFTGISNVHMNQGAF